MGTYTISAFLTFCRRIPMSTSGLRSTAAAQQAGASAPSWVQAYGAKHRPCRVTELPVGIELPKKVRIYQRTGHYILQWWDRAQKKTLSQRIKGDLLDAIVRAREIDVRLIHSGSTGAIASRLSHEQLVVAFVGDLVKRADAGEIDPRTVDRYRAPL